MTEVKIRQVADASEILGLDAADGHRFTFSLDETEEVSFYLWYGKHDEECTIRDTDTATRDRFTFSKASIGDMSKVRCACGASQDLTDLSCW